MNWLLGVTLACGLLCLYVYGRYSVEAVLEGWAFVLTPDGCRAVAALREQIALDAAMVDHALTRASAARKAARLEEAVRLLELAFSVVEEATPDRLVRLRAMSVLCRMAAAILPLPPLRPRDYRLRQLTTATGLGSLGHHLLVSAEERFRLRLCLLRFGFRLALRVMGRSTAQARGTPVSGEPWSRFATARADFARLDAEHLESFRVLMMALTAQERAPA